MRSVWMTFICEAISRLVPLTLKSFLSHYTQSTHAHAFKYSLENHMNHDECFGRTTCNKVHIFRWKWNVYIHLYELKNQLIDVILIRLIEYFDIVLFVEGFRDWYRKFVEWNFLKYQHFTMFWKHLLFLWHDVEILRSVLLLLVRHCTALAALAPAAAVHDQSIWLCFVPFSMFNSCDYSIQKPTNIIYI